MITEAMRRAGYKAFGATCYQMSGEPQKGWGEHAVAIYEAMERARIAEAPAPLTNDVIIAVGRSILPHLPAEISAEALGALSYDAAVALQRAQAQSHSVEDDAALHDPQDDDWLDEPIICDD